ncbi:DUF6585 family protein [Streptomyces californicus]|uniref:DUF6585 family protein n=1 Tax=Streptomyces californicus TaxID=67351 RepID=UPI0034035B8E
MGRDGGKREVRPGAKRVGDQTGGWSTARFPGRRARHLHGGPARGEFHLLLDGRCIRLHLYEHGLVAAAKKRVHAVRYDSTGVLQGILRHTGVGGYTDYTYRLTDVDGARVTLQGRKGGAATGKFSGREEWGAAVHAGVTRAQLPDAVATLNSGGRVGFGKLWLTRDQLGAGRESAQWREIE